MTRTSAEETPRGHRILVLAVLILGTLTFGCQSPLSSGGVKSVKHASVWVPSETGAYATISIAGDAGPYTREAARDLADHLGRICPPAPQVVERGEVLGGAAVYVGDLPAMLLPDARANPETWRIHVTREKVFLGGRTDYSNAFAVYDFLERHLGVHWLLPSEAGTVLTPRCPIDVDLVSEIAAPARSPRIVSGFELYPHGPLWARRNRHGIVTPDMPRRRFQNHMHRVFSKSRFAESHREYFPLIDGVRWVPPDDNRSDYFPCTSNPGVVAEAVKAARNWFDEHPEESSFSVGMDDVKRLCECEPCRALDGVNDAADRHNYSNRYYRFVNEVARGVAESHPDKTIGTLIYDIVRQPPRNVSRLEDNVHGYLTQDTAQWWNDKTRARDLELTATWARRCRWLSRYDYYGLQWTAPRYYPHLLADSIAQDERMGIRGQYVEMYPVLSVSGPMMWSAMQLHLDPTRNIDELLDVWFESLFPVSHPTARAVFDRLEQAFLTPKSGRRGWGFMNLEHQVSAYRYTEILEVLALAERMVEAAPPGRERELAEAIRLGLIAAAQPVVRVRGVRRLSNVEFASIPVEQGAAALEELHRLVANGPEIWATVRSDPGLAGRSFAVLDAVYRRKGKILSLPTVYPVPALSHFAASLRGRVPDEAVVLQRLAASFSLEPWSALARLEAARLNGRLPPNLVRNPSFETLADESDIESSGDSAADWTVWARDASRGRFGISRQEGTGGGNAAVIGGSTRSALHQRLTIDPGRPYLIEARIKSSGPDDARSSVRARWQTLDSEWLRDAPTEVFPLEDGSDEFRLVQGVVVPPGQAATLVLLLVVDGDTAKSAAIFDDVAVYPIGDGGTPPRR